MHERDEVSIEICQPEDNDDDVRTNFKLYQCKVGSSNFGRNKQRWTLVRHQPRTIMVEPRSTRIYITWFMLTQASRLLNGTLSRSKRIDIVCRITYPIFFAIFNLTYWVHYLSLDIEDYEFSWYVFISYLYVLQSNLICVFRQQDT